MKTTVKQPVIAAMVVMLLCVTSVLHASSQHPARGWVFGFDFGGASVAFDDMPGTAAPSSGVELDTV